MVNASAAKLFRHLQLLLAGKVGMEALEVDPRCSMICQNTQMHMPLRAGPIRRDTVEEGGCLLLLLFLSRRIREYKGIVTVYGMPEMEHACHLPAQTGSFFYNFDFDGFCIKSGEVSQSSVLTNLTTCFLLGPFEDEEEEEGSSQACGVVELSTALGCRKAWPAATGSVV